MQRPLATIFTAVEFLTCSVGWMPLMGLAHWRSRRDPTRREAGRCIRRFGRAVSALTPLWDFSVQGDAPQDIAGRAYVVVSNHESNADPFLLSWLPWDMRWIAKAEMFKLPLFGLMMRWSGDIPLRRGDRGSVVEMMAECRRTLDGGLSVMMFPEGTRSRDGRLRPFKDGAFALAIEAGVPILPVAIAGTHDCLPKGSAVLGEARAVVRVLPPIDTQGLTASQLPELRDKTRECIAAASADLRDQLGIRLDQLPSTPTARRESGQAHERWGWLTSML